ncbi:MAG: hypothetical protein ABEK29_02630, partial [Bradymonadaceae bacterium]
IASAQGWIDQLAGARAELLDGDLRPAYLLWLAAIGDDRLPYDKQVDEPPIPRGLSNLTASQEAICQFFGLDDDRLAPALEYSEEATPSGPDWRRAVAELSVPTMQHFLVRFADKDPGTRADLLSRLREHLDDEPLADCVSTERSADDYLQRVQDIAEKRERREAEQRRRRREKRLNDLWKERDAIWAEVADLIETRDTSNYDTAVDRLAELHDAAEFKGESDAFADKIRDLRERHSRLHGLKRRMNKAGLPG